MSMMNKNVFNLGNKFLPMMLTDGWYTTAPSTRARDYPNYLENTKNRFEP
jgi:hypothetical protein